MMDMGIRITKDIFGRKLKIMQKKYLMGFLATFLAICIAGGILFLNSISIYAENSSTLFSYMISSEEGVETSNEGKHDYINVNRWAKAANSYLVENPEGGYTRLEYSSDKIYIENWSDTFSLEDSKELGMELSVFGGFYSGEEYNFIVFGQNNPEESNDVEVMRVVKYDKNWNRLSQCSVNGANTYAFAQAGSLDMAEADGKLIIHTCHEMYASSDGNHHQANMTFVIEENSMTVNDSYFGIMNIKYGYVSHSFNQFVVSDGEYIYRMDHGDANPRALVLTKAPIDKVTSATNVNLYNIGGTYEEDQNDTGLSAGGLILSGNTLMAAASSVDQESSDWDYKGTRNIFVAVTDTGLATPEIHWLTKYTSDSAISVGNPYIIKGKGDISYVLWEEKNSDTDSTVIRIAEISNENGNVLKIYDGIYGQLSDCEPILTDDNKIVWYTTNNSTPIFYELALSSLNEYAFGEAYALTDCTLSMKEQYTYTGEAIKPEISLTYNNYTLRENVDYTVSMTSGSNRYPGSVPVTIKGKGAFQGTLQKTFTINPVDISSYRLVLTPSEIEYDGERHDINDVTVAVYNGDTPINNCYGSVSYYRGKDAGRYEYTFTPTEGKGYTGSLTAYLTITPKPIEKMNISLSQEKYIYDGNEKKPTVVLMDGDNTIDSRYYTVSYSDNINAGTATVTLEAKNNTNYKGTVSKKFSIEGKDIENCNIEMSSSVEYRPGGVKPAPNVYMENELLKINEDYTVSYSNNDKLGTATVIVSGKGNYTGTKSADFTVTAASVEQCTLQIEENSYTYDGTEKKPEITVKYDEYTLEPNQDFNVTYSDNINAGDAKVIVQGKGSYKGELEGTFEIGKKTLEGNIIFENNSFTYTGKEITPSVTLQEGNMVISSDNYDVSYTDNVTVGNAEVKLTGKGNYEGTVSGQFKIAEADIQNCDIGAIKPCEYHPEGVKPEPVITLGDYTLVEGQDYSLAYENNRNIGTNAKIIITGQGNFNGQKEYSFEIVSAAISRCKISLEKESYIYTDGEIEPKITAVMDGEKQLSEGTDYQVSYENNQNAGTGYVVVSGIGNYTNTTKKSFIINPKGINNMIVKLSDDSYVYDGNQKKPEVQLLDGERIMPTDIYTVTYYDNTNAGTARLVLTGDGNYNGTVTAMFTIAPRDIQEVDIEGNSLSTLSMSYNGMKLIENRDYRISTIEVFGEISASIIGENNYTGVIEKLLEKEESSEDNGVSQSGNLNDDSDDYESLPEKVTQNYVNNIYISGISKKIAAGKKIKLTADIFPNNASNQQIIWSSSNPKVANVNQNGVVSLKKKTGGKSVIITATAADGGGVRATYKIKAMKGVVKKVSTVGSKSTVIQAGKALKLKAKVSATAKANKKLIWTSSNEEYATVKNGKVKTFKSAKGKKVKITAMATDGSNKKATFLIKIK